MGRKIKQAASAACLYESAFRKEEFSSSRMRKELEKKIGIKLIEDEAHLGVDNYWYAKQKSKLLIKIKKADA